MEKSRYYEIGTSKTDITPPLNIPYLGFSPRHCKFKGIHDRLFARSAVICDGENEVALINIDAIGFTNTLLGKDKSFTGELRDRIIRETGIPANRIMITSAHIHSTPDTLDFRPLIEEPGAEAWLESIMDEISISVKDAKRNRFKACMKAGKGQVEGISVNRCGEKTLDTEMVVILFESLESEDCVIMINYACHPVIVQVQDMISGDFPGAMQSIVEKVLKGKGSCMFLQGACGDINPKVNGSRLFSDVYSTGLALAGEAIRLYGMMSFKDYPEQPVLIKAETTQLKLPSRPLPDLEERQDIFRQWNERNQSDLCDESERKRLIRLEEIYFRLKDDVDCYDAEIQVLRVGECILAGVSGEMFCEMGLSVKEKSYPLIGIPVGYANGYIGYIAPPDAWEKGRYEVLLGMWSKVGPESYEIVNKGIGKLIEAIK